MDTGNKSTKVQPEALEAENGLTMASDIESNPTGRGGGGGGGVGVGSLFYKPLDSRLSRMTSKLRKLAIALSFVPMGGALALFFAFVGLGLFGAGVTAINDGLNKLKVYPPYLDILVTCSNVSVLSTAIVTLYGLREKCRLGPRKCGHCERGGCLGHCCGYTCKNFVVKPLLSLICTVCFLVTTITIFFINIIYVLIWSMERACDGTVDTIEHFLDKYRNWFGIVDELEDTTEEIVDAIQGYCDVLEGMRNGGYDAVAGLFLLVFAHFLTLGYWMKYSTLGGVRRTMTMAALLERMSTVVDASAVVVSTEVEATAVVAAPVTATPACTVGMVELSAGRQLVAEPANETLRPTEITAIDGGPPFGTPGMARAGDYASAAGKREKATPAMVADTKAHSCENSASPISKGNAWLS